MDAKELKLKRTNMFKDLYSGRVPEQFPIFDAVGWEFLLQYAGKDLLTIQYDLTEDVFREVFDKAQELIGGDAFAGILFAPRNAVALMLQRSRHFVMSKTGMLQHPEISTFDVSDYDEFIKNPFDFMFEHYQPRANAAYDTEPLMRTMNLVKTVLATVDQNNMFAKTINEAAEKYGYFSPPAGTTGSIGVPFDFLADSLRSFTKINFDLRRCPDKVLAALDAIMPYSIFNSLKTRPDVLGSNAIKTHMPTFLSTKDFEKFYWPTFNEMVHINAEHGIYTDIFCEDRWDRYIDHLQDLPQGTRMYVEYGQPQLYKDALGKKYVLGGFYPLVLLKDGTQQQCVDKAKEIVDILAPGGNFYFKFDKQAYRGTDIKLENYKALMDYLHNNRTYDNPGQLVTDVKREDTIESFEHKYKKFTSKYLMSFDEFKKLYPPADEKAEPYMRKQYEKYTNMAMGFLA